MRAYCELPAACRAKSDKMCRQCTRVHINKSPGQREKVRKHKTGKSTPVPDYVREASRTPEANAKRRASYLKKTLGWCPPEHHDLYRRITTYNGSSRYTAAEAKKLIMEMVAKEARIKIRETEEAMRERQERERASEY